MAADGAIVRPRRLEDFLGHWRIDRVIDPAAGPGARFAGTASWIPRADGRASYCEDGTLQIDGQGPVHAERRLIWMADLVVLFDDGRAFHTVPALGGTTDHHCPPDHYRVRYDFASWPEFQTVWQVDGPRKSYRMTTWYHPIAGNAEPPG